MALPDKDELPSPLTNTDRVTPLNTVAQLDKDESILSLTNEDSVTSPNIVAVDAPQVLPTSSSKIDTPELSLTDEVSSTSVNIQDVSEDEDDELDITQPTTNQVNIQFFIFNFILHFFIIVFDLLFQVPSTSITIEDDNLDQNIYFTEPLSYQVDNVENIKLLSNISIEPDVEDTPPNSFFVFHTMEDYNGLPIKRFKRELRKESTEKQAIQTNIIMRTHLDDMLLFMTEPWKFGIKLPISKPDFDDLKENDIICKIQDNKIFFEFANEFDDIAFSTTLIKLLGFSSEDAWQYSYTFVKDRQRMKSLLYGTTEVTKNKFIQVYRKISTMGYPKLRKYFDTSNYSARARESYPLMFDYIQRNVPSRHFSSTMDHTRYATYRWMRQLIHFYYYAHCIDFLEGISLLSVYDVCLLSLYLLLPAQNLRIDENNLNLETVDSIYLYSNIITPECINNDRLRLLDIIPVTHVVGAVSKIEHVEFSNTKYKSLDNVDSIDYISFELNTTLGKPVPFKLGPVIIQLHFRKRAHLI